MNRRMRTRMSGGVRGSRSNAGPISIMVIRLTTLRFGVALEEQGFSFLVARHVVLRENQNARIGSRRPSADWCFEPAGYLGPARLLTLALMAR